MTKAKNINISILFISFIIIAISFFYDYNLSFFVMVPSFLILLITSFPILISNEHNLFSPLNYLIYFIFLNIIIRNLYVIYDYPSVDYNNYVFLLFTNKDILIKPILLTLLSFIFFIMGYLLFTYKYKSKVKENRQWNIKKMYLLSFFLLMISSISFIKFITSSNLDLLTITLQSLSSYRGTSQNLAEYNAGGFLRILIQLSVIVFYINYIHYLRVKKKSFFNKFFLIISFFISLLFFFFIQSRSGFLFIFINCFMISYYVNNYKFSYKKLFVLSSIVVLSFSFMTSIRGGSNFDIIKSFEKSVFAILDPLVANNGGIDTSKTSHIINYVDKNNDFKYGSGYLWIFSSFIPRTIWANKPVNIDTEVGMKIYGATTFGSGAVPPGLVAESYWNLGYFGIIAIPFVLGLFVRFLHNYFRNINDDDNMILLYVICFVGFAYSCFGSSIVSAIVGIIYLFVPLYLSLRYISKN